MSSEILVNIGQQETRVALVEGGVAQEIHVQRASRQGMVGNVLTDPVASKKLGQTMAEGVTRYVPEDDPEALRAVAEYADKHAVTLEPETVFRIARTNPDSGDQFAQMVVRLLAST